MASDPESTTENVFGIVLLFQPQDNSHCIELSKRLNEHSASNIALNLDDSLPHVTVVQVRATETAAHKLWEAIQDRHNLPALEAVALYAHPSDDGAWVGYEIRKSPSLVTLHNEVVQACENLDMAILNAHGEDYWPHITLALWSNSAQELPASKESPIRLSGGTTLALALMGKHRVVGNVLLAR